jgi:hypothetical protein
MHDPDRQLAPAKLISTSNTLAGWIDRDLNHAHLGSGPMCGTSCNVG